MCFDHLSEVHAHMSSFAANISLLAKICDPEMYDMVLKATARLMIQINIPEHYLSPVQDPKPKPDHRRKVGMAQEGFASPLLNSACLTREPRTDPPGFSLQPFGCASNGSSSIVAQPKKHAPLFEVWAKQLSKLLLGQKCTLVAPVELPRESARGPTQQSVKVTWQGKTLNPPQRSE